MKIDLAVKKKKKSIISSRLFINATSGMSSLSTPKSPDLLYMLFGEESISGCGKM